MGKKSKKSYESIENKIMELVKSNLNKIITSWRSSCVEKSLVEKSKLP